MPNFVTVAKVGSIPAGESAAFPVNGKMVAIFHLDGVYHALNDFCPHMGAALSEGHVEEGVVYCPWHAWRFKVCDGTWCDNPTIKTDSYEVRLVGDEIQVCVPEEDEAEKAESDDDETDFADGSESGAANEPKRE